MKHKIRNIAVVAAGAASGQRCTLHTAATSNNGDHCHTALHFRKPGASLRALPICGD